MKGMGLRARGIPGDLVTGLFKLGLTRRADVYLLSGNRFATVSTEPSRGHPPADKNQNNHGNRAYDGSHRPGDSADKGKWQCHRLHGAAFVECLASLDSFRQISLTFRDHEKVPLKPGPNGRVATASMAGAFGLYALFCLPALKDLG